VNILVSIHSPYVMWSIPEGHVTTLRRAFPHHTFLHATDDDDALALIPGADVAFSSQVWPEQLRAAPRLRWIHSPAAGIGGMLSPELVESAVVLTNSSGLSAETMAEHVIAVTLALFRRLPVAFARQRDHRWAQDELSEPPGNRTISGARVLVIGLGAIGGAVATRMARLGARVGAVRRRAAAPAPEGVREVVPPERLHDLLPSADIVVITAPQTAHTRGMIGAAELRLMRRHAILINVSRGQLVDEGALVAALGAGTIGGAALDVFEHEPLDAGSPLWDMTNVVITPHTSGFRPDHWDAAVALFADNLRRFELGETLLNVVDKGEGY
jgi:phosphoglycerate dehydrogenase-like enzyme